MVCDHENEDDRFLAILSCTNDLKETPNLSRRQENGFSASLAAATGRGEENKTK